MKGVFIMKKVFAFVLVVALCLSMAACSAIGGKDNSAIVEYVEENERELISGMETAFATSSGMSCDSSIKVEGMGFVITIKIDGFNDIADEIKDSMQTAYDAMGSTFDGMLGDMQKELADLEYFEIVVCEEDGDKLATITAGEK